MQTNIGQLMNIVKHSDANDLRESSQEVVDTKKRTSDKQMLELD